MNRIPDPSQRVSDIQSQISAKSIILYFPIDIPRIEATSESLLTDEVGFQALKQDCDGDQPDPIKILWNHRWEHDKDPETFFACLRQLHEQDIDFRVIVLGESFTEVPDIFQQAKEWLQEAGKILWWGYATNKEQVSRVFYLHLMEKK